jgi:molybdate transport system substrate-binding protein
VIVPAGGGRITSLESLAAPGLRIVMAAPGIPVREYSDQVLIGLGDLYGDEYAPAVYANLVSEEPNVRQAAAKVALGEADAAWVYSSDVTPDLAGSVREIPLPEGYNIRAAYPILELTDARDPALARDFIAFVLSPEGQAILADAGFIPLAP